MNFIKRLLSLILIVSLLTVSFASCTPKSLDVYEEDVSTEKKSTYYVAMLVKNHGVIIVELDAVNAPITVENFVKLVREGFYDGLTFHRVMNNFMIQGGDPNADGTGGSENKIEGEFLLNGHANGIKHERGVISMARRGDSYDSASSQFFICNETNDNVSRLNYQYAAFGHVVEGMDVVDSITKKTVKHADSQSGTIENKDKQAVIIEMKVISYNTD